MRRSSLTTAGLILSIFVAACSNADEELNAASLAFEEKKYADAIEYWTQAMASELLTRKQSAETHAHRGIAHAMLGACDAAAQDAKWALISELLLPEQVALLSYHQGQCLYEKKEFKAAMPLIEKALNADPNNTEALVRKAAIHTALGEYEEAYELNHRLVQHFPTSAEVFNNLGAAALRLGYDREANEYLNKAIELAPDEAQYRASRAGLFVSLGRFDAARDELNAAIEQAGDHPDAFEMYLTRGKIHAIQSRYDDAIADYDRSLALKPDYKPAKQAKETLVALLEMHGVDN